MDRNAGEGEYPVGLRVPRGVSSHDWVVPFEIFGENIGVQENLGHRLESKQRFRGPTSFLVGKRDNFVKQGGIFLTAEQAKSLCENSRRGALRAGAGRFPGDKHFAHNRVNRYTS